LTTLNISSDTTAITLATMVYELARRPHEVQTLRAELAQHTKNAHGEYMHQDIANLPHLNGFINEVMRLHPAIPSVVPRKTPPEGMTINDAFIPGDMTVFCPQWVIGRCKCSLYPI
jgi:tryprostatin B 6-hydroxylase